MHKTTVILPDDLFAARKSARLPLVEGIRRGLDGTGDTARHTAAETRLALIETRLAQLEASTHRVSPWPADDDDLAEAAEPVDPEEIERRAAEAHAREMDRRRTLLLTRTRRIPGQPCTVTVADATGALGCSSGTARGYMHELVAYGYARQPDRKAGTGQPYEWVIDEPTIE